MKLRKRSVLIDSVESYACSCGYCGCGCSCFAIINAFEYSTALSNGNNKAIAGGFRK